MSDAAVECVVIGAGVVGLAVARALAIAGLEVMVLEREYGIGFATSSRNSEVIHAGIYYPKGSLKAASCVEGRHRLYAYCAERGIPHKRIGKLIVACAEGELALLDGIRARAAGNGVDDLAPVDGEELRRMEPALCALGGLFSPSTGIIDSHALMLAYQGDAEAAGGMIVLRAPVEGGRVLGSGGFALDVGGDEPMRLSCRILVNSAGIEAPALARRIAGIPPSTIPRDYLCRGVYFSLSGRAPFSHLIYPAPEKAGLGVHLTLDLAGQARFGPDVEWIERIDYAVDPRRGEGFYAAIRRYWPGLPDGALQPGYAGIRPKIVGPGDPAGDFVVQGPQAHGVPGLVNLYGIESPGLTASLPLADRVLACLECRHASALEAGAAAG
ncbi:MAG: NAD(P)/FAD-dependent oxidoreductase [Alphaproteobacteria bacterium]|nr:NAD(P)/FAD-dependent oxidoreductase [Alphaproteobacteria bacterium]